MDKSFDPSSVLNFSAGPSAIPLSIKKKFIQEFERPISIFERSHKSADIEQLWAYACAQLRALLSIPDRFEILLMPGGARLQISSVFLNLSHKQRTGYLLTGYWTRWAIREAKRMQQSVIPLICQQQSWDHLALDSLYYCDNETLAGSYFQINDRQGVPCVIVDMTSSFLCCPVNFEAHDIIIVGCQKNLGLPGCSLVLYDRLKIKPHTLCPSSLNYEIQSRSKSQETTPSVMHSWMIANYIEWIQENTLELIIKKREEIARALYLFLDQSLLFINQIAKEFRSTITITFNFKPEFNHLKDIFNQLLHEEGFFYLKAHQNFSDGYRISLYNSLIEQDMTRFIKFLYHFEERQYVAERKA